MTSSLTRSINWPFHSGMTGTGVHDSRRLLHIAVGVIDLLGHAVVADVEVLEAALGLGAPVPIGRNLNVAEAVELPPHPGGIEADGQVEYLRCFVVGFVW